MYSQNEPQQKEKELPWWLWLLGLFGLGVTFAPSVQASGSLSGAASGSGSYTGGSSTTVTNNPPPPPAPAPPTGPQPTHLPGPLQPWPRAITPNGYMNAPRYQLTWPFQKSSARPVYIGQPIDHYHQGVDYPATNGESVHAVEAGTVEIAQPGPFGAPGAVALLGSGGRRWVFVHVNPVGAMPRQVQPGDVIATVGGTHLHVGLTVGGTLTDPQGLIS